MSTPDDLAARMYPAATSTPPPAAHDGSAPPADGLATPAAGSSIPDTGAAHVELSRVPLDQFAPDEIELMDRDPSVADALYGDGGIRPDTPGGYAHALDGGFAALERDAREAGDQVAVVALAEGRKVVAELMHELAVPTGEAKQIASAMGAWHGRELTDEQVEDLGERAISELRAEWGKDFPAKVRMAQRAAAEATRRAPWLRDLWRTGAGNDPALIRHFAEIGLRNARKARRARK